MKKLSVTIVMLAVVASLIANVFLNRWLTAKVSTLPYLNRLNLLNPQAPIVIKETQEIRISQEGEIKSILQRVKNRSSEIGVSVKDEFIPLGTALNYTSDGVFISSLQLLPLKAATLQIRLDDGRILPVVKIDKFATSSLAFLKAEVENVPVAALANERAVQMGDRLVVFGFSPKGAQYFETQVNFLPKDSNEQFDFQKTGIDSATGAVVANYKSEVLGLLYKDTLVTSSEIKPAFEAFLKNLERTHE